MNTKEFAKRGYRDGLPLDVLEEHAWGHGYEAGLHTAERRHKRAMRLLRRCEGMGKGCALHKALLRFLDDPDNVIPDE